MTIREFGLSDVVLEILAQCFSRKTSDIKVYFFHLLTLMYFPLLPSLSIVLMKTGRSLSFRPAVSHLLCAGFTEI